MKLKIKPVIIDCKNLNEQFCDICDDKDIDITRICIESLQLETVQFDTLLCHTCVTKEPFANC